MKYSPLVLFTYKRLDTLKSCIESIQKCKESSQSDLIIFSDYPASELDKEKVNAVRQFLPTINGFKSVEIIKRDKNLGVDYNIIEGIKMMSTRFKQFIVVEDDIVVQDGFLYFMNFSLNYYENYSDVLTISAYSFVDKLPNDYYYDVYFAKRTCPWGWATWSNKIKDVDWEVKDSQTFLSSKKIQKKFNKWGSDRSKMFIATLKNKIRAWDIRLEYYQFKNDSCTLYPTKSFVENIGFGNIDASNTFGYNRYKTKLQHTNVENIKLPNSVFYNRIISKNFISKNSISQRIFTRLMNYFIIARKKIRI